MSFYLWKKNESKRLIGRLSFMNVWKLTYCTIKFFTAKLYENTYFHILNITHACRKNNQITATFMENQGNTLIITKKWKLINMHWCSLKTETALDMNKHHPNNVMKSVCFTYGLPSIERNKPLVGFHFWENQYCNIEISNKFFTVTSEKNCKPIYS